MNLIQWHSIGHSGGPPERRTIHPSKLPDRPAAWQWFIDNVLDPRVPRVLLHNPFGIEPPKNGGGMAFDQYVNAQTEPGQKFAWLTDNFVSAWSAWLAADPTREVIAYIGTLHDHRDNPGPWQRLSQLSPSALSWRLWLSTRPLLDAGCSIAIDSTGYLDPVDADRGRRITAAQTRLLEALGAKVYVEPNPSHPAWFGWPQVVYDSVWRGRRKHDPDGRTWPWELYTGEIVRLVVPPHNERDDVKRILDDGHTAAVPVWMLDKMEV